MEYRTADKELFGNVESLLESIKREPVDSDVAVVILKINNPSLQTKRNTYDLELFGKSLLEWVKLAFGSCPTVEVCCDMNTDVLSAIKPHLGGKKYTAVFYADTPLLQRRTFLNILDWVQTKRMNVCKLERGFVFVTEYAKTAEKIYAITEPHDFGKEDFLTVFNMAMLENAGQILKQRILNYHKQNGVMFIDEKTTFIDADVTIGKDVVIYPNNIIQGATIIEDNCVIQPFSNIVSSKIGNNSCIISSYIEKSEIAPNSKILPFTTIIDGEIKKWK